MRNLHLLILITISISSWSCSSSNHEEAYSGGHHETVMERVKHYNDTVAYEVNSKDLLENGSILRAEDLKGREEAFFIENRTEHLKSFPCTECHTEALEVLQQKDGKNAHWNIQIEHADSKAMNCATCHDTNDTDNLHSITGQKIDFNHSYKLCSQCHSTQYKDWIGGAHGKRLGGWVSPRISKTCVGCHNPHKPAFAQRWPARLNTTKLSDDNH